MRTFHRLSIVLFVCLWAMLPGSLWGQTPSAQPVGVDIYRLERQDTCMVLDMSVNLSQVRIIPDCTVFLVPVLRSGSDSLELAPLMLNGPQSDRMYRRKRALGYQLERLSEKPYLVLREGEHPLPAVSYRARVPYNDWMAKAELRLRDVSCDCDARLQPIRVEITRIPPVQVVLKDTVLVHDTIYMLPKKAPAWKEVTEYKGHRADIYFPGGSFEIIPEHYLNREAWWQFNKEVNSLQARKGNTLLGITATGSEVRKAKLKSLAGSNVCQRLIKEYFPRLHRVSCRIDYLKTE